ncbi:MAG: hypothetical protein RI963_966 [Planctomycetota bacterium]
MSWLQKINGRRKSIEGYLSRTTGSRGVFKRPVSKLRVESLETRALLAGLSTDLDDYAPGTMATLYGEGFRPGEAVDLRIVSSTGGIGAKFRLVDGGVRDADGVANGAFATSWYVDESNADAHLTAMATGQLSGEVAVAKFTDSGKDSPINISVANGWTPGGSNGRDPVTTVTCAADKAITQVSIKTGTGGGFVIENLTGIPGDENTGSMHSPVIVKDGYLGNGNAFSTTSPSPASGPYYAVSGIGTAVVTVRAVNGAEQAGGGIGHVDFFCDAVPDFDDPITIQGRKLNDLNGNGAFDADEPGIAGWPIVITIGGNTTSLVTQPNGSYSATFTVSQAELAAGIPYHVQESLLAGWTQTYGTAGYSGTFTRQDEVVSNADFGNFKNFNIDGIKFEDHDGDGFQDPEDHGLADWAIDLAGPNGMVTATTDAHGRYRFDDLGPGTYSVVEPPQAGWTQTFGKAGYSIVASSGVDHSGRDFGTFKNISIFGVKFYDANANSARDTNEPGINGWTLGLDVNGDSVPDVTTVTSGSGVSGGSFSFGNLGPGSYTVYELNGLSGNWLPTTTTVSGTLVATSGIDQNAGDFGNVKVGAGGGLTLGFWSNKNGQNTMNAGPGGMAGALSMLSGLNLKDAHGNDFNPTSYTQFRTWLLKANSTNMSYMLSAQSAAMSLNVFAGKVSGTALVYAPNTNSANAFGFATVNALMAEANTALGTDGYTPANDVNRGYQERLKNALDRANNNLNFVLPRSVWFDANGNGVIDAGEI